MAELIRLSLDAMLRSGTVRDEADLRRKACAASGKLKWAGQPGRKA